MIRLIGAIIGILAFVALTWVIYVSLDVVVPFSSLELRDVSLHGRTNANPAQPQAENGRVLVMFSWRAHEFGARCVRVHHDVAVGVGGVPATRVHLGGGVWTTNGSLPWPRHRCVNEALFEVERAMLPGVVGASLMDGRGRAVLMSARDLLAPPSLQVTSSQPAHVGERAAVVVLPDTAALDRGATIMRGRTTASLVDVDTNRATFTVPASWRTGDEALQVRADRSGTVLRCEGAPRCHASAVPVAHDVTFVVE